MSREPSLIESWLFSSYKSLVDCFQPSRSSQTKSFVLPSMRPPSSVTLERVSPLPLSSRRATTQPFFLFLFPFSPPMSPSKDSTILPDDPGIPNLYTYANAGDAYGETTDASTGSKEQQGGRAMNTFLLLPGMTRRNSSFARRATASPARVCVSSERRDAGATTVRTIVLCQRPTDGRATRKVRPRPLPARCCHRQNYRR